MKIFITGAAGFIGSNLVRALNSSGFYDLTLLDDCRHKTENYLKDLKFNTLHRISLKEIKHRAKLLEGHDIVVHLAAAGSVVESVRDPTTNFISNVSSTFALLEACREANIKRFVFSSTGGALMGNTVPPVSENSTPFPISPYGASKLACEGYCCSYANAYGMDITVLRFANVVGPNSFHKKGAVTAFIKAVLASKPIEIYGDGNATRDFLHVNDLCDGLKSVIVKKLNGYNVFHLSSGIETEIKKLASLINKLLPEPNVEILFKDKRSGEVEKNFASYEKAMSILDFKPRLSLSNAIQDTYSSFKTQL